MHRPFIFAAVLLTALAAAATRGESQPGSTGRDPELADPAHAHLRRVILDRWGPTLGLGQIG